MNMPSLVLFDIAGTLVADTGLTLEAYRSVLAEAALPCDPDWLRTRYGCSKIEVFSELLARSGRDESGADELSRQFALNLEASISASPPRVFPEVDHVFECLRTSGCAIGLVTGFQASTAECLRAAGGWSPDVIVGSDEVKQGRPAPDLVFEAMHRAGQSDSNRVACVGDTPRDLEMGAIAGCGWNIGVATGSYTEEELRQCPHTHVLGSVQEIPGLFKGS